MPLTMMKKSPTRVLVLGSGMVGSVIAADLALDLTLVRTTLAEAKPDARFEVTIADSSAAALHVAEQRTRGAAKFVRTDLSDPAQIAMLATSADIVVNALPGWLGYRALEQVITLGKPCCDIAFMPEDAGPLDALAKARNVCAIVDCGVAPGMSNVFAGLAQLRLPTLDRVSIMVGGLPKHPKPPFMYKAPFSPIDVLEEYTRPARIKIDGQIVVREALSDIEVFESAELGALEAFNTDGLRSLLETINAPTLIEKTMRYPGHAALMAAFRAAGLFEQTPMAVRAAGEGEEKYKGHGELVKVRPLDVTAKVLFPKWTYEANEPDATVMRVEAWGKDASFKNVRMQWDLYDELDVRTGFPSMSRVTGFACTAMVRMMADDAFSGLAGVFPPERIVTEDVVLRLLADMRARNVVYTYRIEEE